MYILLEIIDYYLSRVKLHWKIENKIFNWRQTKYKIKENYSYISNIKKKIIYAIIFASSW